MIKPINHTQFLFCGNCGVKNSMVQYRESDNVLTRVVCRECYKVFYWGDSKPMINLGNDTFIENQLKSFTQELYQDPQTPEHIRRKIMAEMLSGNV